VTRATSVEKALEQTSFRNLSEDVTNVTGLPREGCIDMGPANRRSLTLTIAAYPYG